MSKSIVITGLLVSTLALSACGGGGGSMGPGAPTQEPTFGSGAQEISDLRSATLATQAKGGSKTTIAAGVTRFTNSFTLDGQTGTVSVDTVAGAGDQLVQYTIGNQATVFDMTGKAVASAKLPSGGYNGPLDLTYRTNGNGNWQVASGEMNLVLDTQRGTVAIGGIAGNANNNIEFFGDATVQNGKFGDTDTVVRLRDGNGAFVADHSGTTNGILVEGDQRDAIVGLVHVDEKGLELDGRFTGTLFQ